MPAALSSISSTATKLNEKEKGDYVKCPFLIFPVQLYVICAGQFFATLTQARVIREGRCTIEKMPSPDCPVGKSL